MLFIDGVAQYQGLGAFEGTHLSSHHANGTNFLTHAKAEYLRWSRPEAWAQGRWTVERVAALNLRLRGCEFEDGSLDCLTYTPYIPRPQNYVQVEELLMGGQPCNDCGLCMPRFSCAGQASSPVNDLDTWTLSSWMWRKSEALGNALDEYYAEVDHSTSGPYGLKGFAPLAKLFATMADLHPFNDANSRTRLFVLNTELTRLGGHPTMLAENGWSIYYYSTPQLLEGRLLSGYCSFEYARDHGVTPYPYRELDWGLVADATGCCPAGVGSPQWVAAGFGINRIVGGQESHTGAPCSPVDHSMAYYDPATDACAVASSREEARAGRRLEAGQCNWQAGGVGAATRACV